jgi:hypothetical protein
MDAARLLLVLTVAGVMMNPAGAVAQSNWSGASSTLASNFDRYAQPINSGAATITDRAQNAFTGTGTALRDGVEAGIRAANQQLLPITTLGSTNNAAPSWPTNPSAASPAPSWATNATTPGAAGARSSSTSAVAVNGGWTSIGTSIAAPPLLIPQSPMATANFGATSVTAGRNGPNFPATAANDTQPLHSPLVEPSRPSISKTTVASNSADDWANGWSNNGNTQPVTIGRTGSVTSLGNTVRESDLVPLQSNNTASQDLRNTAAGRTSTGWPESGNWAQPSQPSLGTQAGIGTVAAGQLSTNGVTNGLGSVPFNNQPQMQPQNGQPMGNFNTVNTAAPGYNPLANGSNQATRTPSGGNTANEQPWMPLILSVLTLAGSLAANLFLGMSYLDARQKYQSLVRKTADTFRRVKAAAA